MKYRIVKETRLNHSGEEEVSFIPQYKRFLFWNNYYDSNRDVRYTVNFARIDVAIEYIEREKRMVMLNKQVREFGSKSEIVWPERADGHPEH